MKPARPSLDLYPPPGQPSNPPTWEDIERLAQHYPQAYHCVVMVERGDWTREQALIVLVYSLAHSFSSMFRAEVERRATEMPRPVVKAEA